MARENQDALRRFKAEIFQVLAHPTRVHIVECLRDGELPVSAIIEQTGIEPANASQHLALLRARRLVTSRKEGNQVFYALRDQMLTEVLDVMRQYFQTHLEDALSMLKEI
ncbi:MAG: ArsR/SmtB family transcription factor [Blastocatellales bacterium]